MSAAIEQRNQDATCYIGNLDEKVNEELLWELMLQVGSVVNVHMPKDKVTGKHQGYGFSEYRTEEDAEYAIKVLNMVKLFGKPIKVNKASQDKRILDIGANLFIGNLDSEVDEKLLHDTFSAFGGITQIPKIMIDPESGASKGYAFISFDSFEASDLAIECMNGQYLCNRPIVVQYAFKKDTPGERHGTQAERILAASTPQRLKPNTIFSSGQGDATNVLANAATTANPMAAYGGMTGMGGIGMSGFGQVTPTAAGGFYQPNDYQYLQYAANPMMMQQMVAMGYGAGVSGVPVPPPLPAAIPMSQTSYGVPPPPPPMMNSQAPPPQPPFPSMGMGMSGFLPPPPPPPVN